MRLRNFRLWIILFGLIMVIGAVLYQQSQTNREQLESQAVKGMEITRKNVLNAYNAYHEELESYIQRNYFSYSELESNRKRIAISLNEAFGGNVPIIDSSLFIGKNLLGTFPPAVQLNSTIPPISLIDINHPLSWNPRQESPNSVLSSDFYKKVLRQPKTIGLSSDDRDNQWLIHSRIPLDKLMKKDRTNKFFDAIVLTDEQGMAIFPDSLAFIQLMDFQKILKDDTVAHHQAGIKLTNLEISNIIYKVFYTPLEFHGQRLYLLGLKESRQFDKAGLKINFTLLSTLVFALIMLFCTVPIISTLTLERGDVLNQNKVFGVGLSLMLLMIILGFGASFQFHLENSVKNEKSHFETLPRYFRESYQTLESKLDHPKNVPLNDSVRDHKPINEILRIQSGKIQKLHIKNMEALDFGDEDSFIDISNREYVAYFNQGNKLLFMGSHYSRGSGLLESVISRMKTDSVLSIEAITFSLEKKENNFQKDRFLVVKQDGKVLFKSQKIATPLDQIHDALTPQKWMEIQSLMDENKDHGDFGRFWEIPLYLNGHQYVGILQLMDNQRYDQAVWIIYLINKNLNHVRSSLISAEAVSLILVYVILLMIITLITKLSFPPSEIKQFNFFTYDWLYPSAHKRPQYFLLMVLFVGFILIFLLGLHSKQTNMLTVLFLAGLITTQSSISLYLLVGPHAAIPGISRDKGYLIGMGLLWLSLFIGILYLGTFSFPSLVLAGLLAGIIFLKIKGNTDIFSSIFKKQPRPSFNTFVGFLSLWTLLIGFLPGYAFHAKVHDFELKIWQNEAPIPSAMDITWINQYEKFRRGLFGFVGDLNETEIIQFISPDRDLVYQAFGKVEKNAESNRDVSLSRKGQEFRRNFANTLPFYLLLALLLAAMWFLVKVLVKKIYLRDFYFDKHVGHSFEWDRVNPFTQVFLCGLDSLQNRNWVIRNFKLNGLEDLIVDNLQEKTLLDHTDSDFTGKKGWLIENLHCHSGPKSLMDLLVQCMAVAQKHQIPLILSSGKSWKELLKSLENETERMRFSELFSPFFMDFVPLDFSIRNKSESLDREMEFGYNQSLLTNKLTDVTDEENVLLLIQRYNKAYYANIWSELNFQEKKVCYYFSKEGFFNYAHWDTITELVQKGILYHDEVRDRLFLFNRTFKHFLLTHITDLEIAAFVEDEKNNGNAHTIQVAAVSFVLILVALIGYFDRNFLNEAYAYLSGFLGLLGTVYSMISKGIPSLSFRKK
ncbi:MFS transporter [Pararhodonellum marinum]|uniref:MFS transporter n=1 Tax=Pararhodonellum marinum TaxID=2755358 RepID=UPI00188E2522|nr:MFS transporter [Pararhodonellum marinum]